MSRKFVVCSDFTCKQIINHFQLCKTLCKHPDRLIEFGVISEQLSQLLRMSILWMVKRGKLEHIVSWKYVRYFELYDETTINDIISIASVEMVSLSIQLKILLTFIYWILIDLWSNQISYFATTLCGSVGVWISTSSAYPWSPNLFSNSLF